MSHTIKQVALYPCHHTGVGIRKQHQSIAFLTQTFQRLEVTTRSLLRIALPGIFTLLLSHFFAYQLAQFLTEFLYADQPILQITEDATLHIRIQMLFHILKTQFLKTSDSFRLVYRENHSS